MAVKTKSGNSRVKKPVAKTSGSRNSASKSKKRPKAARSKKTKMVTITKRDMDHALAGQAEFGWAAMVMVSAFAAFTAGITVYYYGEELRVMMVRLFEVAISKLSEII